jgi:hypothetical protein
MGNNLYYNVNDICKDNANYNNKDNYTIKPFSSKNEDFRNDSFSLEEKYRYRSEASEIHFTPYNSGFKPFPSQNLNNLEVAQLHHQNKKILSHMIEIQLLIEWDTPKFLLNNTIVISNHFLH